MCVCACVCVCVCVFEWEACVCVCVCPRLIHHPSGQQAITFQLPFCLFSFFGLVLVFPFVSCRFVPLRPFSVGSLSVFFRQFCPLIRFHVRLRFFLLASARRCHSYRDVMDQQQTHQSNSNFCVCLCLCLCSLRCCEEESNASEVKL